MKHFILIVLTVLTFIVNTPEAYSFSKHAENHLDAIHLFITTYNLAIQHKATVG